MPRRRDLESRGACVRIGHLPVSRFLCLLGAVFVVVLFLTALLDGSKLGPNQAPVDPSYPTAETASDAGRR